MLHLDERYYEAPDPDVPLLHLDDRDYETALPSLLSELRKQSGICTAPILRDALEKLQLNDAALSYQHESSVALGPGFRAGFLGLLHMDIVQERLEREYEVDLLATSPTVEYQVLRTSGDEIEVDSPGRPGGGDSLPRRRARPQQDPS